MSEHHEHLEFTPVKQRRWLRWVAGGSVALGAAETALGGAALMVDGLHNVLGDPMSYWIKDAASTQHHEVSPAKVRTRLKVAGYILCVSSLFGVGKAALHVTDGKSYEPEPVELALAGASVAYGSFAARKLHVHGHDLAHHHGVRHAVSDVLASTTTLAATAAAMRGIPYADAIGAMTAAGITIGFNLPTEARLAAEAEPTHSH